VATGPTPVIHSFHASSIQPSSWLAGLTPRPHHEWNVSWRSDGRLEVVAPSYSIEREGSLQR
jgi:hypothetical protein